MPSWIAASLKINPFIPGREIFIYELSELGFSSFEEDNVSLRAFIEKKHFNLEDFDSAIEKYKEEFSVDYTLEEIEQRNWNAEWESNFQPVVVNHECRIRAPFHPADPTFILELIIQPQMSFGTGHHETTWLMSRMLYPLDLKGKEVLDMGCGTGVLAILAAKKGAAGVTAIDIDEWSVENTKENAALNNISGILVEKGTAALLAERSFHVILANINRNVLLEDMKHYCKALLPGGLILFSGIFTTDVSLISDEASALGLKFAGREDKNNWVVLQFRKE